MPAADIQIVGPPNIPAKQNLVVRYRGRNQGKPILLLAHLDVVAALRSDWPRDPFTLYEENGYFLGRGTADDRRVDGVDARGQPAALQGGRLGPHSTI